MARIAIITHEHPNEVIAHRQAKAVTEILRRAGHEVVEYRHPLARTLLGIVHEAMALKPNQTAKRARLLKKINRVADTDILAGEVRKAKGADFAYNFHTTPQELQFQSKKDYKKGFFIGENYFDDKSATIEIGCKYATHEHAQRNMRILESLVGPEKAKRYMTEGNQGNYLTTTCPFKENKRRLSPALSNKIAAAIISDMKHASRG